MNVPLCFLEGKSVALISPVISSMSWEPPEELWLKVLSRAVSEGDDGEPSVDEPWWLNLNIWIVSVDEDTQSKVDDILKDML